jgi:hypothetical protein
MEGAFAFLTRTEVDDSACKVPIKTIFSISPLVHIAIRMYMTNFLFSESDKRMKWQLALNDV